MGIQRRKSRMDSVVEKDFLEQKVGFQAGVWAIFRKGSQKGHKQRPSETVSHRCFPNRKGMAWPAQCTHPEEWGEIKQSRQGKWT